jgi:ubiquinone/menaquinone biosynthesis C-methylase UbiE
LDFADASVDLVTCCQAVHWFDIDQFYREADRVLRPGGALAVYGYHFTEPAPSVNNHGKVISLRNEFYAALKEYSGERRKLVDDAYTTIPQLIYKKAERYET